MPRHLRSAICLCTCEVQCDSAFGLAHLRVQQNFGPHLRVQRQIFSGSTCECGVSLRQPRRLRRPVRADRLPLHGTSALTRRRLLPCGSLGEAAISLGMSARLAPTVLSFSPTDALVAGSIWSRARTDHVNRSCHQRREKRRTRESSVDSKYLSCASIERFLSQEDEERVFLGENARASTPSRRVPARD